jgi:hypothetical protein
LRRIAIRGVAEVREHAPVLRGSCSDAELPLRYQAEHDSLPRYEPVQSGAAGGHALTASMNSSTSPFANITIIEGNGGAGSASSACHPLERYLKRAARRG